MKKAQFTKPLSVPLQPGVFFKIKEMTDEKEIAMAQWVRELIERELSKLEKEESKNDNSSN